MMREDPGPGGAGPGSGQGYEELKAASEKTGGAGPVSSQTCSLRECRHAIQHPDGIRLVLFAVTMTKMIYSLFGIGSLPSWQPASAGRFGG